MKGIEPSGRPERNQRRSSGDPLIKVIKTVLVGVGGVYLATGSATAAAIAAAAAAIIAALLLFRR